MTIFSGTQFIVTKLKKVKKKHRTNKSKLEPYCLDPEEAKP